MRSALTVALVVVTFAGVTARPAVSQGPPPRQQVYTAGTPADPQSRPLTGYAGELFDVAVLPVGAPASEPTLGVAPDGSVFFAANSLFHDSAVNFGAVTDTLRSRDGGATWTSVQPKLATGHSVIPVNADPYVHVDPDTGRVFNIDLYSACSWLNYSDDGGETWSANPLACGGVANDHQTLTTGPPPPNLAGEMSGDYPKVVYYCFHRLTTLESACGRSLDGGDTFLPTLQPSFLGFDEASGGLCTGLHGHVKTDSEGRLFVPKGHCGTPWIGISSDGGDSWTRVKVSDVATDGRHLSVAVDSADNLYFAWWDAQRRLPYLAVSTDHGATWGEPRMIAPPGVKEVNFPVVAAGDRGRVAVSFPSTNELGVEPERPWNHHVVVSVNALDAEPVFLSAMANDPGDPIHRGDCFERCGGLWDFVDAVVAPDGTVWAATSDDCVDTCVTGTATALPHGNGLALHQTAGPSLRE